MLMDDRLTSLYRTMNCTRKSTCSRYNCFGDGVENQRTCQTRRNRIPQKNRKFSSVAIFWGYWIFGFSDDVNISGISVAPVSQNTSVNFSCG
jgi:hypothetical protein